MLESLRLHDDPDKVFRTLFERYHRRIMGFFSRRGFGIETCRELSQETFLRVYRSRRSFRGEVPLTSWIFQIAANLYRNELRRRQADMRSGEERSLDNDDENDLMEAHTGGRSAMAVAQPLAQAIAREQVEELRQALDELPPQMRRAMQLRYYHGYRVAEIATVMRISESTAKVHLHQGRNRLRQALADRLGELSF